MTAQKQTGGRQWHVVEVDVDGKQEELAGWLMMQLGANGCEVTVDGGNHVRLRATFEKDALPNGDLSKIASAFDEYGLNNAIQSMRISCLDEEDWLAKWKQGFVPFQIGPRLLISPVWEKGKLPEEQTAGRKIVYINPGLAFGTGFHETTQFCLLALQDYIDGAMCVLDVGSGSGILSIAARLLNSKAKVVAVENDPVANRNAIENFATNNVVDSIELVEGTTDVLRERAAVSADLLLANLTYEDHKALMADYLSLTKSGGHMAFAGILLEKRELMRDLLHSHKLEILQEKPRISWVGFVARKSGAG